MNYSYQSSQDQRIVGEASRIQSALQSQGFNVHHQLQQPGWTVYRSQCRQIYHLTFQSTQKPGWMLHPTSVIAKTPMIT